MMAITPLVMERSTVQSCLAAPANSWSDRTFRGEVLSLQMPKASKEPPRNHRQALSLYALELIDRDTSRISTALISAVSAHRRYEGRKLSSRCSVRRAV